MSSPYANPHNSPNCQAILAVIKEYPTFCTQDLAAEIGIPYASVLNATRSLRKAGMAHIGAWERKIGPAPSQYKAFWVLGQGEDAKRPHHTRSELRKMNPESYILADRRRRALYGFKSKAKPKPEKAAAPVVNVPRELVGMWGGLLK